MRRGLRKFQPKSRTALITFHSRIRNSLLATALLAITGPLAAADTAYLRPDDQVLCCGDSITAPGTYQKYVHEVLLALYPDNAITLINLGSGGKRADFGVASIQRYTQAPAPTMALFMFGVNDTGWNQTQPDAKVMAFTNALQKAVTVAQEKQLALIFLRETHFAHGANPAPDAFEVKATGMLDRLQAAQTALAATNQIPIIDVRGAYQRALDRAWAKDPAYEFTPGIIHPTPPGQAAMAGEILRACGAGCPLSPVGGPRGALHLTPATEVTLALADATNIIKPDGAIPFTVAVKNQATNDEAGTLMVVVAGQKFTQSINLKAGGGASATFTLPAAILKGRYDTTPVYMAFVGQHCFAADSTLFFYSRIQPAAITPVELSAASFVTLERELHPRTCPVTDIRVGRTGDRCTIDFTWADTTPVMAQAGVKDYFGVPVPTPLNLKARDGQPCDAVECLFDLRPAAAIGRWTSNIDANPAGILRVGVYQELVAGKPVAKVMTEPAQPADMASLISLGEQRYRLTVHAKAAGPCVGFSMRVTDNTELKTSSTQVFLLAGYPQDAGKDPLAFVQLGTTEPGILYRLGY